MPQKTRREKERAAQRRETGQYRAPIAPPPIETTAPDRTTGLTRTAPSAARQTAATPMIPRSADAEFNYSYVYADLRRIAILAVLCFGIMIALAFVLSR
jgi:hypothetical protein